MLESMRREFRLCGESPFNTSATAGEPACG